MRTLYIGMSMSRCLADIACEKVCVFDVLAIICNTKGLKDDFEAAWEGYQHGSWHKFRKEYMRMLFNMLQPRFVEPRQWKLIHTGQPWIEVQGRTEDKITDLL